MAKSTREWKQPLEDLFELPPSSERPKSTAKHCDDAYSQFDAVEEANGKVWEGTTLTKAVRAEEEHKVGGGQVEIDVFEAQ